MINIDWLFSFWSCCFFSCQTNKKIPRFSAKNFYCFWMTHQNIFDYFLSIFVTAFCLVTLTEWFKRKTFCQEKFQKKKDLLVTAKNMSPFVIQKEHRHLAHNFLSPGEGKRAKTTKIRVGEKAKIRPKMGPILQKKRSKINTQAKSTKLFEFSRPFTLWY